MLNSEYCIWHLNSTWLGRSFRTSSQLSGLSSDCTHISLISGSARQMTSLARNRTRGRRRLGSLHVSHCPISRVLAPATLPVSILYDVSIKRLPFYYLNNSVNISTDFDIFGTQHPEGTWSWKVKNIRQPHLYTVARLILRSAKSDVSTIFTVISINRLIFP